MLITMVSGTKQKHVPQKETNRLSGLVSYTEWKVRRSGNPKTAEGLLQGHDLFYNSDIWLLPSSGAADK